MGEENINQAFGGCKMSNQLVGVQAVNSKTGIGNGGAVKYII